MSYKWCQLTSHTLTGLNQLLKLLESGLRDYFECTEWSIFAGKNSSLDLEQYTSSVLSHIHFCMDNHSQGNTVITVMEIHVFSKQKPQMTKEVKNLLKQRYTA